MTSPLSALTSLPHKGKIIKIRVLIKKHLKHFLRCLVDMIEHSWTPVCSYAAYTQHRPALCNDCPSAVLSSCQALCTPCLWCLNWMARCGAQTASLSLSAPLKVVIFIIAFSARCEPNNHCIKHVCLFFQV